MRKILVYTRGVNWRNGNPVLGHFLQQLQKQIQQLVEQNLNRSLEEEATAYLGREYHQRRARQRYRQTDAVCLRCGSRRRSDFSRNGHRQRQVLTQWGVVTVWLPRVVCQCGGSVRLRFSLLQPYQRFWDDIAEQLQRWASFGQSLRQMQATLNEQLQTDVGLRVLNEHLHAIKQPVATRLSSRWQRHSARFRRSSCSMPCGLRSCVRPENSGGIGADDCAR